MPHVTFAKAQELHDRLAQDEDIPWADDRCCQLRREYAIGLLCSRDEVDPGAVGRITIVFEDKAPYFHAENLLSDKKNEQGWTDWISKVGPESATGMKYHTAATIDVEDAATGKVAPMVIDPGTEPLRPMTVEEFVERATIRAKTGKVCVYTGKIGQVLDSEDFKEYDCAQMHGRRKEAETKKGTQAFVFPMPVPFSDSVFYQAHRSQHVKGNADYGDVLLRHDWPARTKQQTEAELRELKTLFYERYNMEGLKQKGLAGKGYIEKCRKLYDEANTVQI